MMRAAEQHAHLFITQRAFLQVERHLASAPDLELGGFLAGYLGECPRTHVRYAIVNTVIPFADVTDDPIGARVTEQAYTAVSARLQAHGLVPIGWYRNGAGLGLQLLPDDIETHITYFKNPWQTTLLLLPNASKPKGAFFTYDPRVSRSYCVPFYELFDNPGTDADRLALTCVAWSSYVPSVPVQLMPSADREVVETTVRPFRSEPEAQPPDPLDEWWDAIKDPWVRLKDVATSAAQGDEESTGLEWRPNGAPGADSTPLELPLRPPARAAATPVPNERLAIQPEAPVARPSAPVHTVARPVPPFVGPSRPTAGPRTAVQPDVRPADPRPPAPAGKSSGPASASPQAPRRRTPPAPRPIPAAKAAEMARAATPLVAEVLPVLDERAMVWRRRRRIGFTIAAASFLGVIVLSTIRARTQQVAQAATSAVVMDSTAPAADAAPIPPPSATNALPLSLPAAVDSLSRAIARYRVVENEHRRGTVGCLALDRAHALVIRTRSTVDASRGRITGALNVADSLRVSMVRAEYMHIAQLHRRSGCDG